MGTVKIPIKYFNSFLVNIDIAGFDQHCFFEESRIKGGYNKTTVDFGVRAFVTDENYKKARHENHIIWSGIYNSVNNVNNTNQFSIGESNVKSVDRANGSIQKFFTEETNMLILQEDKVSRALIDKDAVFSANGGGSLTSSKSVIGEIIPFAGRYGISTNPESFAVYGGQKYFSDQSRGLVLRLSQDGITEISNYGMRGYIKDELKFANRVYGMYDVVNKAYVMSIVQDPFAYLDPSMIDKRSRISNAEGETGKPNDLISDNLVFETLSFDEIANGWVSFYSYLPNFGCSLNGSFYTFEKDTADMWEHYKNTDYNSFYGITYNSKITLIANENPSAVKYFKVISYEGSNNWEMSSSITDTDTAYPITSSISAPYIDPTTGIPYNTGFYSLENKYYSWIKNNSPEESQEVIHGQQISGIKGVYTKVELQNTSTTYQNLFCVSHDYDVSSY